MFLKHDFLVIRNKLLVIRNILYKHVENLISYGGVCCRLIIFGDEYLLSQTIIDTKQDQVLSWLPCVELDFAAASPRLVDLRTEDRRDRLRLLCRRSTHCIKASWPPAQSSHFTSDARHDCK